MLGGHFLQRGRKVGATKLGHVADAVGALEIVLTADEVAALEKPYKATGFMGF
jgi:aryl-alcohol dehydrogenase-like predicted oxidoreductase